MAESQNTFTFEISLSVLNHLGRNLYRSFTTVLGEEVMGVECALVIIGILIVFLIFVVPYLYLRKGD